MKKILLILAVFASYGVNAQFNNASVITTKPVLKNTQREAYNGPVERIAPLNRNSRAINGWMSYQDANFITGLQSAGLWPVTADSNILSTGGTPPFHWYIHGLGTSFDPTSRKFYDGLLGYVPPGGGEIGQGTTFTIDSIEVVGVYRRRVSQTDQLRIDITTTAGGATTLQYGPAAFVFDNYGLPDSILRFATPVYDWANNRMQNPTVTVTKTLDLAARNDTTANGLNIYSLALPTPLTVAPGEKVVAYLSFIPAVPDVFGTPLDSSNYWSHYCVESNGLDSYETPYPGEYVSGIIATTDHRYNISPVSVNNTTYLPSTYAYVVTAGFDEPYFGFHIDCPSCTAIGVDDITLLEGVSIFPNPSNGELNISMNDNLLNKEVMVNIVDITGKTVHSETFTNATGTKKLEVQNIASGAYIYTIYSDNKAARGKVIIK